MHKRGYHHGNLHQALVDAALILIEEKGPTGFSLSEAAKSAGVTPAAVYRHFAGRDDLIAEMARQGYEIFADLLVYAHDSSPTPLAALEATGRAWLAFARRHPGHYIAMFESGVVANRSAELSRASRRALDVLEASAAQLTQHMPAARRPPPAMVSAHISALSHGVVELFARSTPGTNSPFKPEDLLETGIGIYLRGLGLIAPDD